MPLGDNTHELPPIEGLATTRRCRRDEFDLPVRSGGDSGGSGCPAPSGGVVHVSPGVLVGGLRRWHLRFRWTSELRIDGWPASQQAGRGDGRHSQRRRLLVGGVRRRHFLLRQRFVPRIDGWPTTQQTDRGDGRHPRRGWVLAGGGRRGGLFLSGRLVPWIDRRPRSQPPDGLDGAYQRWRGLLAGGQ